MKPYKNQNKTRDPRSKESKKIKENFINMTSKEKFNFNQAFISEYEKEENLWNIRSSKYQWWMQTGHLSMTIQFLLFEVCKQKKIM